MQLSINSEKEWCSTRCIDAWYYASYVITCTPYAFRILILTFANALCNYLMNGQAARGLVLPFVCNRTVRVGELLIPHPYALTNA